MKKIFNLIFLCFLLSFSKAQDNHSKSICTTDWTYRIENLFFTHENIENAYSKIEGLPTFNNTGNYQKDVNCFWNDFYTFIKKNHAAYPNLYEIVRSIEDKPTQN